jgi:hypothetical protein
MAARLEAICLPSPLTATSHLDHLDNKGLAVLVARKVLLRDYHLIQVVVRLLLLGADQVYILIGYG